VRTTLSFQISNELRKRVEHAARRLNRGRNSIITQAIEEYLGKLNRSNFLDEARRQSMLATASPNDDEDVWLENADTTGWR